MTEKSYREGIKTVQKVFEENFLGGDRKVKGSAQNLKLGIPGAQAVQANSTCSLSFDGNKTFNTDDNNYQCLTSRDSRTSRNETSDQAGFLYISDSKCNLNH
jgi:hypothetical protein